MRLAVIAVLALSLCVHASAAIVRYDPESKLTFVARENRLEAYRGGKRLWSSAATKTPSQLLLTRKGGAVIDGFQQTLVWFDRNGVTSTAGLSFPPGESVAQGDAVFIASRSDGSLHRLDRDEGNATIAAKSPTALLRTTADALFLYDRITGRIRRIDPVTMRSTGEFTASPFASDLEISDEHAYLVYPRSGELHVVDLKGSRPTGRLKVGAVPIDIEISGTATAISAGEMLVADPSSKKIWREERTQSTAAAFGRGFARGLIGLGLYTPRSADFPTGVDRVIVRRGQTVGFDSSTGTLFSVSGKRVRPLVTALDSGEFDIGSKGAVIYWDASAERLVELARP